MPPPPDDRSADRAPDRGEERPGDRAVDHATDAATDAADDGARDELVAGIGPGVPPGPLADALGRLAEAHALVAEGRRLVDERRRAVGPALAAALEPLPADARVALVHELYWHVEGLRVSDLAAGLGVPTGRVAEVAGPLPVEVHCRTCGVPVVAERTSRSHQPMVECADCAEQTRRLGEVDGAEIGVRVGLRLDLADGCDGTLRQTQDVAFELGLRPEAVLEWSRRRGGFCDCELLVNVLGRW